MLVLCNFLKMLMVSDKTIHMASYNYSANQKKGLHFSKVSSVKFYKLNIFRRFPYQWIALGLFFQMRPNNLMIFHA